MKLTDNNGNVYQAHAEKRPAFRSGCFGRTWDYASKKIDGVEVEMLVDTTWGNWYHFEFNGRWYRMRLYETYGSDELGTLDVKELFTNDYNR
jgi:hypothetical protein